ncbi:hypothetical protein LCGC14_0651370 [marine sediment metagenome]|uniref:Uncharacterized protein n=1 Tax=marine sediment metagenome TaxID=412755 RepID=A0A0F9RG06_9ZZZZ
MAKRPRPRTICRGRDAKTVPDNEIIPPVDETFIKMCVKAEELQSAWDRQSDDLFAYEDNSGEGWNIVSVHELMFKGEFTGRTYVPHAWLPTQAQLWKMVGGYVQLEDFWEEFHNSDYDGSWFEYPKWALTKVKRHYEEKFTSMESLLLAYVMSQKYGKTWDGETWIGDKHAG